MFISKRQANGLYYLAQLSKRGPKYLWSVISLDPLTERMVEASAVPRRIRKRAYYMFEKDRTS
jgi:hypothetical protein